MTSQSLPNLLLSPTSDSWGDERERSVMLEAYAYVFALTQVVLWTVFAVLAWFIPWWATVVLFLAFLIPAMEWQRYTRARDVDANLLAYGGNAARRTAIIGLYLGACGASMAMAVIRQLQPDSGATQGAIIGAVVGAVGAIALGWWSAKRKAARIAAQPDD